jgi:glutathione S-transferase
MALTLVIGNKNYSSWSLRPWIAMKAAGILFEEKLIPLHMPDTKASIMKYSPAGKVPVLVDGDMTVWESLAILDHLADRFPEKKLWPADPKARAHARAVAAEMHAGFAPLRNHCPMNMRRAPKKRDLPADVAANVKRIDEIWSGCRSRFGQDAKPGGPFLFGVFCAADAMYAPVVSRFVTYELPASQASQDYIAAVTALPAWAEWRNAGVAETWRIDDDEVD